MAVHGIGSCAYKSQGSCKFLCRSSGGEAKRSDVECERRSVSVIDERVYRRVRELQSSYRQVVALGVAPVNSSGIVH